MPNPASVYCEQNGGKLELRQDASGGVAGICVFPDGSECDEWAYFRGECKAGNSLITSEPTTSPVVREPTPMPTASPVVTEPTPTSNPTVLRVVYFKGGHVMLWTEGKGSRQLAEASFEQVRISDDGQVIAYLGYNSAGNAGAYGVFAVDADGTNQRLLVGQDYLRNIPSAERIVSFDFAPASHTLYFVTDQYDLHRVNATSGAPATVFGSGKGGLFSFSPNGQWMVLSHPDELVLARPDGTEAHVVFKNPRES